jgi:hypothetical protein
MMRRRLGPARTAAETYDRRMTTTGEHWSVRFRGRGFSRPTKGVSHDLPRASATPIRAARCEFRGADPSLRTRRVWRIEGHSFPSKEYGSKQRFIDEVLAPFGARFAARLDPFRPLMIHSV